VQPEAVQLPLSRAFLLRGSFPRFCREFAMFPILPGELLAGGLELVCYGFTVLAALISYLLMMR
jgi:hypothetical protein